MVYINANFNLHKIKKISKIIERLKFSVEINSPLTIIKSVNMKRLILLFSLVICTLASVAQNDVSASEQKQMVSQIVSASKSVNSLQSDFVQTKHLRILGKDMVSKGKLYLKGGQKLRWEYTSPYTYIFIINGGKVLMKNSNNKTNSIDVNSSKMFKSITRIMMSSMTGECLSNSKEFKVTMKKGNSEWIAQLVPQQKELASMFSLITLHINPSTKMVTQVELKEKSGDTTIIKMSNTKKNQSIQDKLFSL